MKPVGKSKSTEIGSKESAKATLLALKNKTDKGKTGQKNQSHRRHQIGNSYYHLQTKYQNNYGLTGH